MAQKCGLRQTQDAQTPTLRSLIPMPSQRKECHMWDKQGACFEGQRPNVTFASGPTASLGRLDWGPGRLWYPYDVTAVTRLRLMGLVGMFGDWELRTVDCGGGITGEIGLRVVRFFVGLIAFCGNWRCYTLGVECDGYEVNVTELRNTPCGRTRLRCVEKRRRCSLLSTCVPILDVLLAPVPRPRTPFHSGDRAQRGTLRKRSPRIAQKFWSGVKSFLVHRMEL